MVLSGSDTDKISVYTKPCLLYTSSWLPLLINRLWIGKITDSKLEASKSSGNFTRILKELLAGFEVSRMYGLSEHMENTFQKEKQELEKKRFWARFTKGACENTGGTASLLLWMGTLLLGTYLTLRNLITVGMVLQVNQLLNLSLIHISWLRTVLP